MYKVCKYCAYCTDYPLLFPATQMPFIAQSYSKTVASTQVKVTAPISTFMIAS